jgi:hypothetical protein
VLRPQTHKISLNTPAYYGWTIITVDKDFIKLATACQEDINDTMIACENSGTYKHIMSKGTQKALPA